MEVQNKSAIKVEADVKAPVEKVWDYWNKPEHITQWNQPSAAWHCPRAENDLRADGKFTSRMEAKDGSAGFDFSGIYDEVKKHKHIAYTLEDGRKVSVEFKGDGNKTEIKETFDPENENPRDMQRDGWQAILDNFKRYAESN